MATEHVTMEVTTEVTTERGELESQLESQLESEHGSKLKARIVTLLRNEVALGKEDISKRLGQKMISGSLHEAVRELVEQGWLEMTMPQKPQSRLQKYRLTQGKHLP